MIAKNAPPECVERIRLVCRKKCLTQADFAVVVGKSRTVISSYLNGKLTPSFQVLQKFGASFQVDMNWLFFGEGEMFRAPQEESAQMRHAPTLRENPADYGQPGSTQDALSGLRQDPGVEGIVLKRSDVSSLLNTSGCISLVRVEETCRDGHNSREIVVTRAAFEAHQDLVRRTERVCAILRESGVCEDTVRRASEEFCKITLEPLDG